jgi:hypothetical protein
MNLIITDTDYLRPALDRFFKGPHAVMNAHQYVGERNADARKLIAELSFRPYLHGALVCRLPLMGYEIHLAYREEGVRPNARAGIGDFYRQDSTVPVPFTDLVQCIAYILASNW